MKEPFYNIQIGRFKITRFHRLDGSDASWGATNQNTGTIYFGTDQNFGCIDGKDLFAVIKAVMEKEGLR